jgi:tryptophanyl-tRNA synthetase
MPKKVILSGIQPTGNLHIGNYLGAVKNWVKLQNFGEYQMNIFIADLHSLTGDMSAKERHEQITKTAAELVAAGIDPEKTNLFVQSHVTGHTELGWIFNCVTPLSELERMTQFKDKAGEQKKNINAGLFNYPVLQAADILLYHGTHVPVGEDQVQHVELTRDIAKKFNKKYLANSAGRGKYFPETKVILTEAPRVKSLLEPNKKMSKSLGQGHVIELADEPKVIEKKLKKAVTATAGGEGAPGVENLLLLLKNFGSKKRYDQFVGSEKDGSIRYGDLKSEVAGAVGKYFADFRKRRKELLSNHDQIASILIAGAEKVQVVADQTMADVRKLVGIR